MSQPLGPRERARRWRRDLAQHLEAPSVTGWLTTTHAPKAGEIGCEKTGDGVVESLVAPSVRGIFRAARRRRAGPFGR